MRNNTIKRDACNIPTKIALSNFLIVYQKRKVFGSLRINPFTVLHDIPTENASFSILVLCLIFQANTSFLFCLPTCKIDRLVISYTLSSVTKKAQSLQDNGLNVFSWRLTKEANDSSPDWRC